MNLTTRLDGRVAVVTGASSGNGRAIALRLAREGAAVICADVASTPLSEGFDGQQPTDQVVREEGGRALFVRADVTRSADMTAAAAAAVDMFGSVDIWVNNAGVGIGFTEFADVGDAQFERLLEINLRGVWHGCQAAVAVMRRQEIVGRSRGRIVNIGSIAGAIGQPGTTAYGAVKASVHGLTRALALELAPDRIHVNAVAPGFVQTALSRRIMDDPALLARLEALYPLPLGSADDVAAAAAFLGSADADFVTGVVLPVDGGLSTGSMRA